MGSLMKTERFELDMAEVLGPMGQGVDFVYEVRCDIETASRNGFNDSNLFVTPIGFSVKIGKIHHIGTQEWSNLVMAYLAKDGWLIPRTRLVFSLPIDWFTQE
jgi:hypothetical protein